MSDVTDIRHARLRVANRALSELRQRRETCAMALSDILDDLAMYEQEEEALVREIKRMEGEMFDGRET